MSCCGNKRTALTAQYRRSWNRDPAAAPSPPRAENLVVLRYAGAGPLAVRGPSSGRVYELPETGTSIGVDPADVAALTATLLFERDDSRSTSTSPGIPASA